jgi:hypothetical protein
MTVIEILKVEAAILTIATGAVSLIRPRSVTGFTGLEPVGGRGVTELRAILGGVFIALGAYPLIVDAALAYRMAGVTYLVVAAVRGPSIVIDRSPTSSNWISLMAEIVLGVILVW